MKKKKLRNFGRELQKRWASGNKGSDRKQDDRNREFWKRIDE